MPTTYRAAVIGCGGMGRHHARGYRSYSDAEVVAVVDVDEAKGNEFVREHAPGAKRYADHRAMLEAEKPDVVSICLWPHLHAPVTADCARAGIRAIHCEKPMAPTWGEALDMAAACEKAGTQLTFNHQRRFLPVFRKATELVAAGRIGRLTRLEATCSNMIDWGTHWIDMMFMFNDEVRARWVMGQIDAREVKQVFGLKHESQAICQFKFENGVRAILFTGAESDDVVNAHRLIGTEGMIEIRHHQHAEEGKSPIFARLEGSSGWENVPAAAGLHGLEAIDAGIADLLDSLEAGREPELSVRKALRTTEVIFALYESSRRRARIDLPLTTRDSAFLSMLGDGVLGGG